MFGPALLVVPVVDENVKEQNVYLPENKGGWYDFYTGKKMETASGNIRVPVVMENIPVFVKAGSVLPLSEDCQYSAEVANKSWVINIYPGADGCFDVYEDEGVNYNYEKGQYATIPFTYNDAEGTLTIGDRAGEFPGMLKERTFNVVKVSKDKPQPFDAKAKGVTVKYDGKRQSVSIS